jgi:hypothetical protein
MSWYDMSMSRDKDCVSLTLDMTCLRMSSVCHARKCYMSCVCLEHVFNILKTCLDNVFDVRLSCYQFIIRINESIRECQLSGGAKLQVGCHANAESFVFYPHICLYVGNNQGSSQTACIKQGRTYKPCRLCESDRLEIHDCSVTSALRNSGYVYGLQCAARKVFAKKVRNEHTTVAENNIMEVCRLESLNPVPSALLGPDFELFPSKHHMLMFPPDLLHTVCGGILKSWIFWTMVIVVRVGEMDSDYKDNVALLDSCIADFPVQQSLRGKFKSFPKGVSEFVKSATASGISSKDVSTSGLGGIDHQFVPSMVEQMLLCIGVGGEIVPNTKNWNGRVLRGAIYSLGSVTDAVFTSGFMALDLFYTLSRSEFSLRQLKQLGSMIKTLQVHFMRLFSMKQALLNSSKPYSGIKIHMLIHFVDCILYWGAPKVWDMIRYVIIC